MREIPGFTPAPAQPMPDEFRLPDDVPSRAEILAGLGPRERFALLAAELGKVTRPSASVQVHAQTVGKNTQAAASSQNIDELEARIARLADED